MTPEQMLIVAAAMIALLALKGIYDKIKFKKKLYAQLMNRYGSLPENNYDAGRYKYIAHYFEHKAHTQDVVDAVTWNDLDMEMIFMTMNQTCTGIGEEYLYAMLHEPAYDSETLARRQKTVAWFQQSQKHRMDVSLELAGLGKLRNYAMFQYVDLLMEAEAHKPYLNIGLCFLMILSIVLSVTVSPGFIALVLAVAAVNIICYTTYKNKVYFDSVGYITRLARCAAKLSKTDIPPMEAQMGELKKDAALLKKIGSRSWLFRQGSAVGGTILDLLMDYIKMMFHIDLILFDMTLSTLKKNSDRLRRAMEVTGEIDACLAIASYREMKGRYCIPKLHGEDPVHLYAKDMYHPLIEKPVTNSIHADRAVLLTGSNASGKSTFLKTVAVNALLAQTIGTALADTWQASYFRIYSSMALKDNLMANESYFIVEIKSLKRILGGCDGAVPMLCFIDEVLRGTNTVERIAASSQILHRLSHMHTLCFAATHDIELTSILENDFDNYHFQEEVKDDAVTFDYKLKKGRAVSRNAIKLLGIIGFGEDIVTAAEKAAQRFETESRWSL